MVNSTPPIFFQDTINGQRYREQLLTPFLDQVHPDQGKGRKSHHAEELSITIRKAVVAVLRPSVDSSDLAFVSDRRDLSSVLSDRQGDCLVLVVLCSVPVPCYGGTSSSPGRSANLHLLREVLRLFERFDHDVHDATQPTLEDVLTHLSAQIAALTQEVKELRALKEDVDELRAFNDARLVQLEESNEDLVSMTATPKVVIVQPKAPFEATQPPADQDMGELFQEVKGRKPRKRRPSVASLEDQAVEPGPSHGPLSAEVPKKAKKANPQAPQANPNRPAPAKQVAQNKPPAENKIPPIIIRDAAKWVPASTVFASTPSPSTISEH
ncbi:hypothetical protein GEV33_005322 [Tenebrio molitor]|uniref:Uncharacterized protein n=1 Tax=Tenebrio molitor TaxID=7067 RepID=A0A8J6HMQ9_TENMO|nr:hypothetical protein GEV33_005322 [Tenebrio molitor]